MTRAEADKFDTVARCTAIFGRSRSKRIAIESYPEITWLHSHVVVDSAGTVKTYCIYEAPTEQIVSVLNRYQATMGDAVLDHGGTVVDYLGDGLMAAFGAPIETVDHADRAIAAGRNAITIFATKRCWVRCVARPSMARNNRSR